MAMLAYANSPRAAEAGPAPARPLSSLLAGLAGTARMTASASSRSGGRGGPIVSRPPAGLRDSSRVIALVRTLAPEAAATAAGTVPRPPASVVKIGRAGPGAGPEAGAGAGAGSNEAAASASDRYWREA